MRTYKILNHTGDIGIIVYGSNLNELFLNAGRAFFSLLTNLNRVRTSLERTIVIKSANSEELMVAWLGELLYLFDAQGLVFRRFHFEKLTDCGLQAVARGEHFHPERHLIKREIKAVTYHQVSVEHKDGRWEGRIIFDL